MTYQPKVYRQQGGDTLNIASGGTMAVASGGAVTVAAGAYATMPYQALGSSQTATAINAYGVTVLTGTTTGPTYKLSAPSAAGICKWLVLNPTSSGATHRCVVSTSASGAIIVHHSNDGDLLTLNTSAQGGAMLIATGTTAWRVVEAWAVKDPAITS